MPSLTFFTNPLSRGRIVRWMLEEVGEPYETELMDYQDSMKSSEFLEINPMGKVPAIKHGEVVVTEAAAICAYLADAFPGKRLAPSIEERGSYYRWLFFAAGPIEMAGTFKTLGMVVPQERESLVGFGRQENVASALEGWLNENEFVAGGGFTAADVYVASHINWGMEDGTLESRPVFIEYARRMHARPAAKRANEIDDALIS